MSGSHLIISNPPQPEGVDIDAVARLLGGTTKTTGKRVAQEAPEIWLADSDATSIEQKAKSLQQMGLQVVAVSEDALHHLPNAWHADAFTVHTDTIEIHANEGDLEVPADAKLFVTLCHVQEITTPTYSSKGLLSGAREKALKGMIDQYRLEATPDGYDHHAESRMKDAQKELARVRQEREAREKMLKAFRELTPEPVRKGSFMEVWVTVDGKLKRLRLPQQGILNVSKKGLGGKYDDLESSRTLLKLLREHTSQLTLDERLNGLWRDTYKVGFEDVEKLIKGISVRELSARLVYLTHHPEDIGEEPSREDPKDPFAFDSW